MRITKYAQSGFILELENGFRLGWDVAKYTPIEDLENITVDAFIASHIHGDHFSPEHIAALNPKQVYMNQQCQAELPGDDVYPVTVVAPGQKISIGEISVEFFEVDHGPNATGELYDNMGFLISAEGKQIYFCGDMFYEPENLVGGPYDIALVPVGGFYTFGVDEGYQFAKRLRADLAIPMHYDIKNLNAGEEFIEASQDINTKYLAVGEGLVI